MTHEQDILRLNREANYARFITDELKSAQADMRFWRRMFWLAALPVLAVGVAVQIAAVLR